MQNLDTESQISQFEWTLHNGRRKFFLNYRSDIKKIDLIEYRRKGNTWKNNQKFQLKKEEYDKLVDFIPSVLSYVETYKKTCIITDECTVENERLELNKILRNFDLTKFDFSSNTKRKNNFFCTCIVLDPNINVKKMDKNFLLGV